MIRIYQPLAAATLLAAPLLAQQPPVKSATSPATRNPARVAPGAPPSLATPLPNDPKVRVGVLPSGLRYYIRQNPKPEKRAELRLVVNAGSVLENDNQLGLAHFIEHMAFNGTTHFSHNDLIHYLQSIGVRFGADLNAETSFDETVYILPIPTDTARLVNSAFTILDDWAHGETLDSAEVANERGVVREEWRLGKGASDRMLHEWLPIALKGSRYADRLPIGNEQSIMTATPARLRSFYNAWYRPDLEAVIAVGDFNPDSIEAQIKRHFSDLKKPAPTAPKRFIAEVPGNKEPLIGIASDKEATSSDVDLIFKLPAEHTKTVGDFRRDLMGRLYTGMLNARLDEIAQKPDAPFLGAEASRGAFIGRGVDEFALGANVKDGEIARGLGAILAEAKRADEYGFLPSEFQREKEDILRGFEKAYDERDKTESAAYVDDYMQNYLRGDAFPSIEYEYKLAQQILPTNQLADVNAMGSKWIGDENRVIIAESPEKPGVHVPTRGELEAVLDSAAKAKVVAYTETLSNDALVPHLPSPGKVVGEKTVAGAGVTEWTLSNGARVLIKPTDFKADEVQFAATAPGGTSLAPDSAYMSASLAANVVQLSGLGAFSAVDLQKKLSGKVAGVQPSITDTEEGLSGSASPKDLETLFQLIYLDFTAPRFDPAAYQAFQNQIGPYLANRGANPEQVFSDTVTWTLAQHDFRARPVTPATFAEVHPQTALAFYKSRFGNASNFTFVFVGNVDLQTLKPLVERYIASLPAGTKEAFKNVEKGPPAGVIARVVNKGKEPKATTLLTFSGACTYSPQERVALRALTEVFQIELDETLREKMSGTYSPSVGGACTRVPEQRYRLNVEFSSSPENADTLARTVFGLANHLQQAGPTADELEKVKAEFLRGHETDVKQNGYWLGNILARDAAGEDLVGLGAAYNDLINALTPASIQAAARKYFDMSNYARFTLLPEGAKITP